MKKLKKIISKIWKLQKLKIKERKEGKNSRNAFENEGSSVEYKTCSYNCSRKENKINKKEIISFKSFNLYGKNKKNLRKRKIRYKSVKKIQPQH